MNATAFSANSRQRPTIGYSSAGRETDAWIRVVICDTGLSQQSIRCDREEAISYHQPVPRYHDLVITMRFWPVLLPPISQLGDRALNDLPHVLLRNVVLLGDLGV
jgi:hypothetical protein